MRVGTNNADVFAWRPKADSPQRYELEHVIEAAHEDGSGKAMVLKVAISVQFRIPSVFESGRD